MWRYVGGYFDYPNVYANAINIASDRHVFVEVGSWLGRSTSCMGTYIKNSGKDISFYAIDTWEGSDEDAHKDIIEKFDHNNTSLYEQFLSNIKMCGVDQYINPIRSKSLDAVNQFEDESLDFIHIDASHDYENVLADIKAWFPKVTSGS